MQAAVAAEIVLLLFESVTSATFKVNNHFRYSLAIKQARLCYRLTRWEQTLRWLAFKMISKQQPPTVLFLLVPPITPKRVQRHWRWSANKRQNTTSRQKAEDITPSIIWRRDVETGSVRQSSLRRLLIYTACSCRQHLMTCNWSRCCNKQMRTVRTAAKKLALPTLNWLLIGAAMTVLTHDI